jgi:hypothetical protein
VNLFDEAADIMQNADAVLAQFEFAEVDAIAA